MGLANLSIGCAPLFVCVNKRSIKRLPINRCGLGWLERVEGTNYDDIDKRRKKNRKIDGTDLLKSFFLFYHPQIDNQRNECHDDALNDDPEDQMETVEDRKPHVTFSITNAIRKTKSNLKSSSDSNNNYNKTEPLEVNGHESPVNDFSVYQEPADQNNNDSDIKNGYRSSTKLRNHQMQQLLQQHVFSPHQLQQLIAPPMTMSTPKDSLFHFEQKRKQMEILMHQIQEQLHANILQQTHLLQNQSPTGEGSGKKGSSFQLQQKLALQQQELAQQFQLVQRQYLLHQSGMQLLFPHHQQQQLQSKLKI